MRRLVTGGYRVQEVRHRNGTTAFTIVSPDGRVHLEAERFLARHAGGGSDRTYAFLLVDHLRWLECEGMGLGSVSFRDLYLSLADSGVNTGLREQLDVKLLPAQRDRDRAILGHLTTALAGNPLAPKPMRRRHPKMLPDGARGADARRSA